MRRITGCLPLALALLVLAGCGGTDDTTAPSSAPSGEAEPETEPAGGEPAREPVGDVTCADGPPQVVVTDPGEEPRTLMELSPTPGDSAAIDLSMNMTSRAHVDGEESPTMPTPPVTIGMTITVDDVTDDEITMTVVYDHLEMDDSDPELQAVLDTLAGASGTVTTSRRGAFVDGSVDLSGADPRLAAAMDHLDEHLADLAVPLPAEAVGLGATWTVRSAVDSRGITFCNDVTYRLTWFDGDAYELGVGLAAQALRGTIEQAGATAELVEGSGTGSGHSAGRLGFPVAGSAKLTTVSFLAMAVDDGSAEQALEMDVAVRVEIGPRE